MTFTELLDTLGYLEGKRVSVMVSSSEAEGPAPVVVMRGTLGAVEMKGEQVAGQSRGIAFYPIDTGAVEPAVPSYYGPVGFYVNAAEFEDAEGSGFVGLSIRLRGVGLGVLPE